MPLSVYLFHLLSHLLSLSFQGSADPLNSAFHLTYNMVLNLLRVEEINPEYMLERSFYQFQNNSAIPDLEESQYLSIMQCTIYFVVEVKVLEAKRDAVTIDNEDNITNYYKIRQQINKLAGQMQVSIIDEQVDKWMDRWMNGWIEW